MTDAVKPLSAVLATLAAPAGSANAVATASAAAASLPSALANLALGNVLAGVVVERGRGAVLLKTDKGVIQLATNLALKLGASVVLEVQSVGAQLRFAIVSVDQRAPQSSAADVPAEPARDSAAVSLSPRGNGSAVPEATTDTRATLIGRVVTAEIVAPPQAGGTGGDAIPTLLRRVAALTASLGNAPADPQAAAASAPIALPAAETLETILAAIEQLPAEAAEALLRAPAKPAAAPQAPDATPLPIANANAGRETRSLPRADAVAAPSPVPAGPAASAVDGAKPPVDAAAGPPKLIAIRFLDILPPNPAGARQWSARPAGTGDSITLLGTVVATNAGGVELATPLGTLRAPISAGMPVGSQVAFEVIARPHAAAVATPEQPSGPASTAPPQRTLAADPPKDDWPALRDVIAALPPDGDADAIVPKPGAPLGPALLAFLVGLRGGGSAKAWLGAAPVESLESSGKTRLIERLGDELAAQSRAAAVPDRNGWQTMAVPVLDGERFHEIRVHIQKRRQGGRDADAGGGRFIVEATLSALGPLQLDGLVRASRFDLIVRTPLPLPEQVRRDIETLFAQSLSDTTYRGGVSFRGDTVSGAEAQPHAMRHSGVIV